MSAAQLLSVRLEDIRLDGGTQSRAGLDPEVVERYAESVDELPPVDVYHDGESYWLANGFHRVAALTARGRDLFPARIHQGTRRDAILHSCGANTEREHGVLRTREDARRAVERLLSDEEWRKKSDRWIADRCYVSPTWVGKIRGELGASSDVREVTRGGVTYPMQVARPEPASVHGGQIARGDESTFQAPEPDNTVRAPVEHEHQGAPLTAELRQGMRDLRTAGWPLDAIADRYRVTWQEVAEVCKPARPAPEPAGEGEDFRAIAAGFGVPTEVLSEDWSLPRDDLSARPELRFAAPCKSDPDRRTDRDLLLSQWWTPPELAAYLVKWAGIHASSHVLEPAAGTGAIVAALLEAGCTVEAHEIDEHWIPQLRARGTDAQLEVHRGDYLASAAPELPEGQAWAYTWGATNPPYEDGADGRFLARLLTECENVVALVRVNVFLGSGRYDALWAKHGARLAKVEFIVSRPDFANGEEGFDGALSDFVLLRFDGVERAESSFTWCSQRFGGGA